MEREELLRNLKQVREKEKGQKYSVGQLNVFNMVSDVIDYLEHEEKPKVTNLDWLKENLTQLEKENRSLCRGIYVKVNDRDCDDDIECVHCKFNKLGDIIDYLLQERKEPIRLKQWEYDLIKVHTEPLHACFYNFGTLVKLHNKGYFKGIKDVSMKVEDILNNHIIVLDNYEGFEDCK